MAGIKPLFLLVVFAGATLLILQNQTPVIALMFLGTATIKLPLGLWLVGAIALGSMLALFTSLVVTLGRPRRSPRWQRYKTDPSLDPSLDPNPTPGGGTAPDRPTTSPKKRRWGGSQPPEPEIAAPEVWDEPGEWVAPDIVDVQPEPVARYAMPDLNTSAIDSDRDPRAPMPEVEPYREPWEFLEDEPENGSGQGSSSKSGQALGQPSGQALSNQPSDQSSTPAAEVLTERLRSPEARASQEPHNQDLPLQEPSVNPDFDRAVDSTHDPDQSHDWSTDHRETSTIEPDDPLPESEYEVPQTPIKSFRKGSVYAYSYATDPNRESRESKVREVSRSTEERVPLNIPRSSTSAPRDTVSSASNRSAQRPPIDTFDHSFTARDDEAVTPIVEPVVEPMMKPLDLGTARRPLNLERSGSRGASRSVPRDRQEQTDYRDRPDPTDRQDFDPSFDRPASTRPASTPRSRDRRPPQPPDANDWGQSTRQDEWI